MSKMKIYTPKQGLPAARKSPQGKLTPASAARINKMANRIMGK